MTHTVVVGAGGFIGREITHVLGDLALPFRSADVDLRDGAAVRQIIGPVLTGNAFIYSAGIHRQRGDDFAVLMDNLQMVENMIAAIESAPPRSVVFLSSVEVYGAPETLPVTEQTPLMPTYRYAVGKIACELLLSRHCRQAGIPLAILRLPGVYGAGDNGVSIVGRLVSAASGGQPFTLMGDGNTRRDYIHVSDVARAAVQLADEGIDGTLNLATGDDRSLNDLIDLVSSHIGSCRITRAAPAPGDFNLSFDVTAMNRILPGFSPIRIEDGIGNYAESVN
ncbi:MAG: NAD(P)-dependent oxidoreductase [Rhodospirillales bacterium]